MSSKTQDTSNLEKKRAQFTEAAPAKSKTKPILIGALVVLAGVATYFAFGSSRPQPTPVATSTQVRPSGGNAAGEVRLALAELNDGKAKFFSHTSANGAAVRYFVIKSSDGVYRAALDACEVCFHAKQGYHQEGDDMVCNNCGKHFASKLVNEINGGCHPIGLVRTIEGAQLVIKASELEKGSSYF